MLYCNTEKFKDAFLFYNRIDAYKDTLLVLESAIITCSMNGRNEDALEFAQIYLNVVKDRNDAHHINHAYGMINTLKMDHGVVLFPYSGRPYKETTLLDILDKISFEEEKWALDKSLIRPHFPYPKDEGKCIPFKKNDVVTLSPVCLLPYTYYRGQSKRHPKCYPTLYRENISASARFVERLKYCEFCYLLETHPLCTRFKNSFKYKFPDGREELLNFNIDHLALAQHYGIATELMDVTSDKWIAAFFASTKFEDGVYSPFNNDGTGIFYTCTEPNPDNPTIRPIGIQPFSRPGEQRGYARYMHEKEDFEDCSTHIEFKHHLDISEFIYNFTNRSRKLFPDDILQRKAEIVVKSKSFSKAAYDMALNKFYQGVSNATVEEWLRIENIYIQQEPVVRFTEADMEEYRSNLPKLLQSIQNNILVLNIGYKTQDGINILYPTR